MKELHAEYGDDVLFLVVYIHEAHALDGARPFGGEDGHPLVEEPQTSEERGEVAARCHSSLDMAPLRMLIDDMENTAATAYAAHPDRLYLVGRDGKIAYAGGRGPFGFSPEELETAILDLLEADRPDDRPDGGGE